MSAVGNGMNATRPSNSRFIAASRSLARSTYRYRRQCASQYDPIVAKLRAYAKTPGKTDWSAATISAVSGFAGSGGRRSSMMSRVIAIAKTASEKKTRRSRSRPWVSVLSDASTPEGWRTFVSGRGVRDPRRSCLLPASATYDHQRRVGHDEAGEREHQLRGPSGDIETSRGKQQEAGSDHYPHGRR